MTTTARGFCSVSTRQAGIGPGGSAWAARRFVIPELDLPWPANPLDARSVPSGVIEALETIWETAPDIGIFSVAPQTGSENDGVTRILVFDLDRSANGEAFRVDYLIPDADVATALLALALDRDLPTGIAVDKTPWTDIMVCTHGSRDLCCATFGFPLYRALSERYVGEGQMRIWRATHFGGHAFAPTMMTFPDCRSWGHLDAETAIGIVERTADPSTLRGHYRGYSKHVHPELQLLEGEALFAEGWSWLDLDQSGTLERNPADAECALVTISAAASDGSQIRYAGAVDHCGETMSTMSCGSEPYGVARYQIRNLARSQLSG